MTLAGRRSRSLSLNPLRTCRMIVPLGDLRVVLMGDGFVEVGVEALARGVNGGDAEFRQEIIELFGHHVHAGEDRGVP